MKITFCFLVKLQKKKLSESGKKHPVYIHLSNSRVAKASKFTSQEEVDARSSRNPNQAKSKKKKTKQNRTQGKPIHIRLDPRGRSPSPEKTRKRKFSLPTEHVQMFSVPTEQRRDGEAREGEDGEKLARESRGRNIK